MSPTTSDPRWSTVMHLLSTCLRETRAGNAGGARAALEQHTRLLRDYARA